jgi:AcrR family transcriptional regulator
MTSRRPEHRNRTAVLFLVVVALAFMSDFASSFVARPSLLAKRSLVTDSLQSSRDSVDADMPQLYERLQNLKINMLEEELDRPPNAKLGPTQFVEKILDGLLDPYDPVPDAGFRRLLRASTAEWNARIRAMIGAPADAPEDVVASALGTAIARPNQQFGILVGAEDEDEYYVSFPSDLVDNMDGTCWLEARLRGKKDDELLVITGWELQQRPSDGAWIVANIDWQDFRDAYRPGLGREEWERICG